VIVKDYIDKTIFELHNLYENAKSQKKTIYYSKLALIEFCGWLEESMDDIIQMYCNQKLKKSSNKNYIKKVVIHNNFGFHYKDNFRPMLMTAIGIVEVEKLEKNLDNAGGKINILSSTIGRLKKKRNDAAHTFIRGVTSSFDAPSVIINDFRRIYPIMKEIETEVRKINH